MAKWIVTANGPCKTCTCCGEYLPASCYYRDKRTFKGYQSQGRKSKCKVCCSQRSEAWNKANQDRVNAAARERRARRRRQEQAAYQQPDKAA